MCAWEGRLRQPGACAGQQTENKARAVIMSVKSKMRAAINALDSVDQQEAYRPIACHMQALLSRHKAYGCCRWMKVCMLNTEEGLASDPLDQNMHRFGEILYGSPGQPAYDQDSWAWHWLAYAGNIDGIIKGQ